jgi:hypothetical protein
MEENKMIEEAVAELKSSDEAKLKEVIEKWFESTRTDGLKTGAKFISAAVAGAIQKHLKKGKDASLRDYKRMTDDIWKIISVQLTQQNDLTTENKTDEQESSV